MGSKDHNRVTMRLAAPFTLLFLAAALRAAPSDEDALAVARRIEKERIDLAQKLAPSVCAVFRGGGGGSGVIITPDGLVLSNFHVVGLDPEMRIGLNDERIHRGVVLGMDPSGDLGLMRLTEDRKWPCTPLGDSDQLQQGDWVYAMGNPFLLATDFTPTITLGVVSGIHRYQPGSLRGSLLYPDCIQIDASINPGNSGGPLFSFRGEVVGINGRVSLRERGRVNIGVGYAISSNQIRMCLPELRAGKIVEHGTLSATVRDFEDPDWPGGVRVTFDRILEPGPAHDAGIQLGDVLVEFQGQPVTESNDFLRRISVLPKGRRVQLRVASWEKDGWKQRDLRLVLEGIPLLLESQKQARSAIAPRAFLDHEIDRSFDAVRSVVEPIGNERRTGSLSVTGRDPLPLVESYAPGRIEIRAGDNVRVVEGDEGTGDVESRKDAIERVAAWNDMLQPEARTKFARVEFTGGALVGGRTVDRFEVETSGGDKRVYFIEMDPRLEHGRLARLDLYSRAWVRWISLYFDDWRTANGLARPYKVTILDREEDRLLQTITYEAIQRS